MSKTTITVLQYITTKLCYAFIVYALLIFVAQNEHVGQVCKMSQVQGSFLSATDFSKDDISQVTKDKVKK